MYETFFRTETARVDRKNTLLFFFKVVHQNSAHFACFWSKSKQLFLNGKIYIIFDHNALLSIISYLLILLQLFLRFWIEFVCFPWFFGSKIEFWWTSLFFVKKPYFSRPKNPLFTKFFKKYSKIRYYGTTSLAHKNMNFRAI